ncbi:MAG: hypothetical protein V4726_11975 [Verrucomicrobiota bacterium]
MTPRNSTPHHADENHQNAPNENRHEDHRGRSEERSDHIAWAHVNNEPSDDRQSRQQNS